MSKGLSEEELDLLEYERELRIYYLKCILMEGSKIILFILAFWKMGLIWEYWMALLALMLLRNHGGGIHCRTYLSCLAVSFTVLYASILAAQNIYLPVIGNILTLAICGYLGYKLVPIVSDSRPDPSPDIVRRSKWITVIIISVFCILICIRPNNLYIKTHSKWPWTFGIKIPSIIFFGEPEYPTAKKKDDKKKK
ncbi:MAG: accessory gene regulator B family protein [Lachnospiraceae bacterium]|nr:accessory gene regulator B family protein [Lachnospiraceae bacterium]